MTKLYWMCRAFITWLVNPLRFNQDPSFDEAKKEMVLKVLAGPNGVRRLAAAAKGPFKLDPRRVARELKAWCPTEQLPQVMQYLYVEVHETYNEPAFRSYFE